ncbi:MAG: uridine kinase [Bacteroidetes bacterium]|nr:MAG: uridine kinase [Bacteroidota bacterium]
MPKPYIIGICGGSASGKTFLLRQLLSQLPTEAITLISQDNYYKPLEDQIRDEEGLVNFDHPDSVDLEALFEDIKALMRGKVLERQEYTFNNPKIKPHTFTLRPSTLLIVEGLFVFHRTDLAKIMDLKIFVDADEHVRLSRRLRRDHTERGYSYESILRDYEKFVAPMYHRYVAPTRQRCDFIIPNNKHMYKAIQVLVNHLRTVLEEEK